VYNARKIEEEESAEEETVKILVIFSRINKIHEEELQDGSTFKELLKNSKNRSKSLKIPAEGRIV
jgi:hypothetical protein